MGDSGPTFSKSSKPKPSLAQLEREIRRPLRKVRRRRSLERDDNERIVRVKKQPAKRAAGTVKLGDGLET